MSPHKPNVFLSALTVLLVPAVGVVIWWLIVVRLDTYDEDGYRTVSAIGVFLVSAVAAGIERARGATVKRSLVVGAIAAAIGILIPLLAFIAYATTCDDSCLS